MTRCAKASSVARGFAALTLAAAVVVPSVSARAETGLPASAVIVRSAVVAMSLADAALPFAAAVTRVAATRRDRTTAAAPFYDRRTRFYRDPFPLFLGVGY